MNKTDKPQADPDRVKNELSQHGVISEEWGGDTQFVHVSAKSGEGIEDPLEAIQLVSEVLESRKPFRRHRVKGSSSSHVWIKAAVPWRPCWYKTVR